MIVRGVLYLTDEEVLWEKVGGGVLMLRSLLKASCTLVQARSLAVAGKVIKFPARSFPGFKTVTVLALCLVAAAASAVDGALAPAKPVN